MDAAVITTMKVLYGDKYKNSASSRSNLNCWKYNHVQG